MKADPAVARRFLWIGATLLAVGIALAASGMRTVGSIVTLAAAALLVAGLHTFGRAGPDEGEPASARDSGRRERPD